MIIKTYTEEQTLAELLKDYAYVRRQAQKRARKYLKEKQSQGRFIRDYEYERTYISTPQNNRWYLGIVYCQKCRIPWNYVTCCIVEGEAGKKFFYLLRGMKCGEPYFVKLSSHALKRFRERGFSHVENKPLEELALLVFKDGEKAICKRYIDIHDDRLFEDVDDAFNVEGMKYFVITYEGFFIARRQPKGNFEFLTYISPKMSARNANAPHGDKWSKEGNLGTQMFYLHAFYNKNLYSEAFLEETLYQFCGRRAIIRPHYRNSILLLKQ